MKTLSPIKAFCVYFVNWFDSEEAIHALTHDFAGIYGAAAIAVALFLCACVGHRAATTERMLVRSSAIAGAMVDNYYMGGLGVDYVMPSSYYSTIDTHDNKYWYDAGVPAKLPDEGGIAETC